MSNTLTPVGVPLATFARQVAALVPGVGPATSGTLGAVKVGSGLAVAGDGTLSATLGIGTTTGTAADGGVVAGYSTSITAANTNAASALTAANNAQPKIAAASGSLLGGPATLGGTLAAIALGAGLALSGGSLGVAYGTGANQAVAGSSIGAANGVAGLDATGKVPLANISAALIGGNHYIGTWNPAINTPAVISGTSPGGTNPVGSYYVAANSATLGTAIDGITVITAGDWITWNGTIWQKLDGQANPVASVAGRQGAVTLGYADISGLGTAAVLNVNAASGVAGLDANASVSAQTVIATGAAAGTALGLGDLSSNLQTFFSPQPFQSVASIAAAVPLAVNIQNQTVDPSTLLGTLSNLSLGIGTFNGLLGTKSTCVGFGAGNAMGSVTHSDSHTFIGYQAGNVFGSTTTPGYNNGFNGAIVGVGAGCVKALTSGSFSTFVGCATGGALTNSLHNTIMGHGNMSGLDPNVTDLSTGQTTPNIQNFCGAVTICNTVIGNYALQGAGGYYVGQTTLPGPNLTPCYNTCIGYSAGQYITGGSSNTLVGYFAGRYLNTGADNIAMGYAALGQSAIAVNYNIAIGHGTLLTIQTNSNTVVGYKSATSATTAVRLTGLGSQAIANIIDSTDIVAVGQNAAQNLYHGSSSIYIGSNVGTNGVQGATGTISNGGGSAGTTLTIATIGTKNLGFSVGDYVFGTGIASGTKIVAFGTGTGGTGTYTVNTSQLVASTSDICNRDFTNTIAIGTGTDPTQSNQVWLGAGSVTNFVVGALGGLVNIGQGYVALGTASLNSMVSATKVTSVGSYTAQYALTPSYSVFVGDGSAQNFLAGANNTVIGTTSASGGSTFNATANGTTLTVTSRINGGNSIVAGGLYIGGTRVANILAYGTSGTTGTGGNGTYALDTNLGTTYSTSTPMAGADYSNVTIVGCNIGPTASNQAIFGNSQTTSFSIGGSVQNGLMFINSQNIGIGVNALLNATNVVGQNAVALGGSAAKLLTSGLNVTAIGDGSLAALTTAGNCAAVGYQAYNNAVGGTHAGIGSLVGAGIVNATGTVIAGYNAQSTGDFSSIVVLGANANATANGQIVIGNGVTGGSYGITIGSASQSASIAGSLTIASGATGAAVFGGTLAATGGYVGSISSSATGTGNIGEIIQQNVGSGSAVSFVTSGTAIQVASIILTPGLWQTTGWASNSPGGTTTTTSFTVSIGTTSAAISSANGFYVNERASLSGGQTIEIGLAPPPFRVTTTTTYYLNVNSAYAASTQAAYGIITAIRVG